ncbi:MAG: carboxyl-terminal processing protease [Acidobacteriota bacterium]|nr:carboxyl-terminal processing protease [Acidobacteriota bacterium]
MSRVTPLRALFLILFVLQSVTHARQAPRGETTAVAPPAAAAGAEAERRRESFDIVWRTVKENYFDPKFGGVDWDAVREEFAPRAASARTDRELHALLQQMLNRLGHSHFNIIPPEAIPSIGAEEDFKGGEDEDETPGAEEPRRKGSLRAAEQLTYGIGIDLRVVGGAALVTRVEPGSTAARAGLRTGHVLRSIDGQLLSEILRTLRLVAVYEPSARNQIPAEIIVGYINGPPGTSVKLTFLDGRNRVRRVLVPREHLKGELVPLFQTLPAQFVEFESARLRGGVGYVRFNLFAAPVLEKFCAALRSMKDAPGIILDLRGNRGGLLGLVYGLGGLFETHPVSFGMMRTRAGWHDLGIVPQKNVYRGQLVVLIDAETQSAAEMFAAGVQASGRAVVIGQRSAGATLPSAAKELPTGAILQYAFADFVAADGRLIEGFGVEPNLSVKLNRRQLLAGRDPQLEAALDAIETQGIAPIIVRATAAPPRPINVAVGSDDGTESNKIQPAEVGKEAGVNTEPAGVAPEVELILERYAEATGLRRMGGALLSTRVSKGRIEGAYAGMKVSGTVEVLEKAPDKFVALVNVDGLGVIRRGFTGEYGYMQIPLFGFRRVEGAELAELKLDALWAWADDLRRLYPSMKLKGTEEVAGSEAHVVEATNGSGARTTLYFDARTGLLVRRDKTFFEDFREVDGRLLPFRVRDDFAVITYSEVKHNSAVEDTRFAEEKDCFTR